MLDKLENKKNVEKFDKNKLFLGIVIFFCFVFFVLASIFPYWQSSNNFVKFLSPDENANYFFTKLYQTSGELSFYEKYNIIGQDIIKPRSYTSYKGDVKPVSFLGMIIIYGNLAKIFGNQIIPFLTAFFASLALFFYYLLIKKVFGPKNAFISFLILFSFPVFFYYSARSMFHNVLFLSFFIIGLYFLVTLLDKNVNRDKKDKKKYFQELFKFDFLNSALAGIFFGLAIGVRSSELIWLFPAGLLLLILKWKKISFLRFFTFITFVFIALIPVFYYNQILFNSPFYGGYYEMNKSIEDISQAGGGIIKSFFTGHLSDLGNFFKIIFNNIFYFGFQPQQSLKMLYYYGFSMFWYLFYPALLGFFYLIFRSGKKFKKNWAYFFPFLLFSTILIFYYGSWKFVDNPDPDSFTIGNSYTRYWLPIYIGLIPLASIFILNVYKIFFWVRNKLFLKILSIASSTILVLFIIFVSFRFVYSGSEEGLNRYFQNLNKAKVELAKIISLTEDQSVIITEYHDKFFFPERRVIVGKFNEDNINNIYYNLNKYLPVYYYNFSLPEKDVDYLNNRRFSDIGLRIELVEEIDENFSLYKMVNIN